MDLLQVPGTAAGVISKVGGRVPSYVDALLLALRTGTTLWVSWSKADLLRCGLRYVATRLRTRFTTSTSTFMRALV